MARPVLSGTCPVKLLYSLGHHAAAQFQGFGNLLIAYARVSQSGVRETLVVREGIAGGASDGTFTINKLLKKKYVN